MEADDKPVCIYTLGRFALVLNGRPLTFSRKTPHKPLELLEALIALGGRDVSSTLLGRAVWPEEDSADPRNLFDNTLHRLRSLLGHRDGVVLSDAKLSLNPQRCWVDAWAFDRLVGIYLGKAHTAETDSASAAEALRLYQGHFLERETPHAWLLAYRKRLGSRLARLLRCEGERLELLHRWEAAVEWYERGLEIDPLAENLHQRLMICHRNRGEDADALRVYRGCRELLRTVLGVAPSPATEAIAHAITTGCGAPLPQSRSDL
jgi:DNA-binding SARP family transcriptional activator